MAEGSRVNLEPETGLSDLEAVADELERRGDGELARRVREAAERGRRALAAERDGLRRIDARLDEVLQVVTSMTALDFDHKVEVDDDDDWLIKALGFGLNMMGDEFKRATEDLTEARDRALAANRAKSAFLANMSHELRTPLNAIIGYSELLREECEGQLEPAHLLDLDRVVVAARHLLSLIKDTLDLSKIEAGRMEVFAEVFDVAALVDEVAATLTALVKSRGNRLVVERPPDLGPMRSDRTKLAQTLYNLLSNANKFTTLGTIRFAVRPAAVGAAAGFEFVVEDTGIGIPRDRLDRVFGAFDQGDESITRRFGGTGLGLTLTRHFCEMLGGEVRIDSELGRGSTFTIALPAELPRVEGPAPSAPRPRPGAAILLASPDPALREVVRVHLPGAAIVAVAAAPEVARLVPVLRPAAIVLDDALPEPGVWSTLLAIKAEPELAAIPTYVACLGDPGGATRRKAASLGAADVLRKPLRPESLQPLLTCLPAPERLGRVLVVGRDAVRREVPRRRLTTSGWELLDAADVARAIELLASAPVDALLVDVALPGLPDLLRATPTLPAFAISPPPPGPAAAPSRMLLLPPDRLPAALALHVHRARTPGDH